MRVLILGATGMLGHELVNRLRGDLEVAATFRSSSEFVSDLGKFKGVKIYSQLDVMEFNSLKKALIGFSPHVVINAVGVIKQKISQADACNVIRINSELPHWLAITCNSLGIRLIHLSTDCVFSGASGFYSEDSLPDCKDLYGRSKLLGELYEYPNCLTLRSSIIGLELFSRRNSLIEWYLSQKKSVKGYVNAMYSGITTMEMARLIKNIILEHPSLSGMWHVASLPISKYSLLSMLSVKLGSLAADVTPDNKFICDRSLNAHRFNTAVEYNPPSWDVMTDELADLIMKRHKCFKTTKELL